MRIMVKFSFPTEQGNQILSSGKINAIFEKLMQDLKPEAAYFCPVGGDRGGILFVNAHDSTDVLRFAEPLWLGFGGTVEMTPVMSAEDIAKGLAEVPAIVARYK